MAAKRQLQNLRDFLDEGDAEEELKLSAAGAAMGHPMNWPVPPRTMPRWYQFSQKRRLREVEGWFGRITQEDLNAFWRESAKGQSVYEDAGGYRLRCFRALLALSTEEPYTSAEFIADHLAA